MSGLVSYKETLLIFTAFSGNLQTLFAAYFPKISGFSQKCSAEHWHKAQSANAQIYSPKSHKVFLCPFEQGYGSHGHQENDF